jgi:hypothetical protein
MNIRCNYTHYKSRLCPIAVCLSAHVNIVFENHIIKSFQRLLCNFSYARIPQREREKGELGEGGDRRNYSRLKSRKLSGLFYADARASTASFLCGGGGRKKERKKERKKRR